MVTSDGGVVRERKEFRARGQSGFLKADSTNLEWRRVKSLV